MKTVAFLLLFVVRSSLASETCESVCHEVDCLETPASCEVIEVG